MKPLLFVLLWSATALAQPVPVGTVSGTVTDADTKAPVSDVGILVVGTNRAARTNAAGQYRITNVPIGAQQIRAARLGYAAATQPVTVREGAGTAALTDQPLIVIDGIRAYNDINGFADLAGVGGQSISRFDDLDKESIADVQVLKGAAAAALYGTEAAAGVIVIQTRHGDVGQQKYGSSSSTGGARRL